MDPTLRYTRSNRISWNAIASDRPPQPPQFFLDGGSTLDDFEPGLLPDLRGKRMLHLACASGNDARFMTADMYELPSELRDFDVIYASWGVVCWLPDLDRWARIIVDRLRPGGTLLLCEHHPIWEVLGARPGGPVATVDYFGRNHPTMQTYDQAKRPTGSTPETPFDAFVWPVSDVVMSLIRAGLRIDEFFEAAVPEMYEASADGADRLPAVYVIRARKDQR